MLKAAGVGLVGLANNHIMDYMEAGLRDTQRYFLEAGLPVVGAGLKPDAERAYIFEQNGRRVALLAFSRVVPIRAKATLTSPGIASSKSDQDLANAIRAECIEADFVILMIHWGAGEAIPSCHVNGSLHGLRSKRAATVLSECIRMPFKTSSTLTINRCSIRSEISPRLPPRPLREKRCWSVW